MTSLVRLNSSRSGSSRRRYVRDGVAAAHRAQDAVVARLERHVQVAARGGRLAQRADELVVDVVDLDRREAEPLEPGRRAGLPDEPRQAIARGPVAVAAEVDPGQDDLAVALSDAAADLAEHGVGRAAARGAAHERDHAEAARERAAVLHLDEGANAVEPRVRLDAADRADVARDELRRLLAPASDHDDVVRQPGERVAGEVRTAAGDVDPACVRAARAASLRDFATASLVTQHVLTTATSAPASRSSWPSASSRSRTACASTWETLQPRKRTENVVTAGIRAGPRPERRRAAAGELRRGRQSVPSPRRAGTSPRRGSRTGDRGPHVGSVGQRAASTTSQRDCCVDRDVRRAERGPRAPSATRASTSTPFARRVRTRRLERDVVDVDRVTGAKPSFAAATESTPEPQPTSSRLAGSTSCRSSRQSRVVACAPVPNARPGSITTATRTGRRLLPRRPDPQAADDDAVVEGAPPVLPAPATSSTSTTSKPSGGSSA